MDEIVHVVEDEFVDNLEVFKTMLEDEKMLLYQNYTKNIKLFALIKMYNVKEKHKIIDIGFIKMLNVIKGLLPDEN